MGSRQTEKKKRQVKRNGAQRRRSRSFEKEVGWRRDYRRRIMEGRECCRNCFVFVNNLTFDHLIPRSRGGHLTFENVTILCHSCQVLKGDNIWYDFISLAEEERKRDMSCICPHCQGAGCSKCRG